MAADEVDQDFKLFSKLPYDIRTMIWHASLQPRVVDIYVRDAHCAHPGIATQAEDPIALRVCHESRRIIEPLYRKRFGSVLLPPQIRVNFELDTICIEDNENNSVFVFFALVSRTELSSIRSFAIGPDLHEISGPAESHRNLWGAIVRAVKEMDGLREFLQVHELSFKIRTQRLVADQFKGLKFYRSVDELIHLGVCTMKAEAVTELPSQTFLRYLYGSVGRIQMRPVYVSNRARYIEFPLW
jgi:hypothetical protein